MEMNHEIVEQLRSYIGKKTSWEINDITKLKIQRFANAIGDENPLYFDKEFARKKGYKDIISPPNFIATAANYWSNGPNEDELNNDGTYSQFQINLPGDFKRMGGGQEIEFINPVYPGDRIHVERKVVDIYTKQGRSGLLCFLVMETVFTNGIELVMKIKERQILR